MFIAGLIIVGAVAFVALAVCLFVAAGRAGMRGTGLPLDYAPPEDKRIMDMVRVLRRVHHRDQPPGRHRR